MSRGKAFCTVNSTPRGHLRVDVGGSTARDVLIPMLPDFMARYPDIRIDLSVSDRSVDLVGDNVDCVIRGGAMESSSLAAALRDDTLVEILPAWRPARYPFQVVYPQALHVTHRLRVFMDWLLEAFPVRVAQCPETKTRAAAAKSRRR